MIARISSLSFAALLMAGGVALAQPQPGQGGPTMQQQERGPGMMQQGGPGAGAEADDERDRRDGRRGDRQRGMRGMERMHGMMHHRMGRHHGMRGEGRHGGMGGMRGHQMMRAQMMRTMIILMDTDGDGALSLEEVQAVTGRFFQAMDADDSGALTAEEIRGFYMGGALPGLQEAEDGEDETDDTGEPDDDRAGGNQ
jgi:hypothetical protein